MYPMHIFVLALNAQRGSIPNPPHRRRLQIMREKRGIGVGNPINHRQRARGRGREGWIRDVRLLSGHPCALEGEICEASRTFYDVLQPYILLCPTTILSRLAIHRRHPDKRPFFFFGSLLFLAGYRLPTPESAFNLFPAIA